MKKIHRFIGDFDLSDNKIVIIDRALVKQFFKVLKFNSGEVVALCDGKNNEALCEINYLDAKKIVLIVKSRLVVNIESIINVSLFCAVLKRENFELVVQKATEVGVMEIIPIITDRTIKQKLKIERLKLIAKEAAEQSGRGVVPVIRDITKFDKAIKDAKSLNANIFFNTQVAKSENLNIKTNKNVGIWIGPEGGWDDKEVQAIIRANFAQNSLGKTILRAETAAIIASYLMCNQ